MPVKESVKAIIMFSGGLDSTLAAKMMLEQGIDLLALHLTSPFCTCDRRKSGCRSASVLMAEQLGVRMVTVAKGKDYFKIIKNPRYGYGSALNPCIDCRIYGLEKAKEKMEEEGAKFIVTGEVLGQRPMSQMRKVLQLIERKSGLQGAILRPLSAKHFPLTIPEMEGWVDRRKLLEIVGRSRKDQMELAKKYDLKDYPCAAGGCLLTDKMFAPRLKDLFNHCADPETYDFNILKIGRHLRLSSGEKLIIPRSEMENKRIEFVGKGKIILIYPSGFPGPVIGVKDTNSSIPRKEIAMAFKRYAKKIRGPYPVSVLYPDGKNENITIRTVRDFNPKELEEYMIK